MDAPPIGRRLKAARHLAGLTVPELAAALALPGLGAKTLGAIERGEREMRPQEIAPIADITGMPISYFAAKTGEALWPEPDGTTVGPIADLGAQVAQALELLRRARSEQ